MSYQEKIAQVYARISGRIKKTPMLHSEYLSRLFGCELYLKCEHLQRVHSFKPRGVFNKLSLLSEEQIKRGLITASGGNHGMAVCLAATEYSTQAKVYLPKNTPEYKIQKIEKLGGKVIMHGDFWNDANEKAQEVAKGTGETYIHPFDDDDVIDGQATLAYEIFLQEPSIDIVVGSIGGGGLMSGVSHYTKSRDESSRVYGVETLGADSMFQSMRAGEIIQLPGITSIAESLGATRVTEKTFGYAKKYMDDIFTVHDDDAIKGLLLLFQEEKQLVEPAASCVLAAIMSGKIPDIRGKKVCAILCGGNFPLSKLKNYIH